jgi:hypothetical protein
MLARYGETECAPLILLARNPNPPPVLLDYCFGESQTKPRTINGVVRIHYRNPAAEEVIEYARYFVLGDTWSIIDYADNYFIIVPANLNFNPCFILAEFNRVA